MTRALVALALALGCAPARAERIDVAPRADAGAVLARALADAPRYVPAGALASERTIAWYPDGCAVVRAPDGSVDVDCPRWLASEAPAPERGIDVSLYR